MSRFRPTVSLWLLLLTAAGCAEESAEICSIVNLVSDPAAYDGRYVVTFGVASVDDEGAAIFLDESHARNGIFVNGIWLESGSQPTPEWKALDGRWVVVEGIFDKDNHGHLGVFTGAIEGINRMSPVTRREDLHGPAERDRSSD